MSVFDHFAGLAIKRLNGHNSKGIKLITCLRLTLSHLCEQKIKNNVQDSLLGILRNRIKLSLPTPLLPFRKRDNDSPVFH